MTVVRWLVLLVAVVNVLVVKGVRRWEEWKMSTSESNCCCSCCCSLSCASNSQTRTNLSTFVVELNGIADSRSGGGAVVDWLILG